MTRDEELLNDPRIMAAIDELRGLIEERYPHATFNVGLGDDPEGVYLTATVDVEDRGEVLDVVLDRWVDLQIDDGLPVYILLARPLERNLAIMREQLRAHPHWAPRSSSRAVGG